jgi:hypothetical protein
MVAVAAAARRLMTAKERSLGADSAPAGSGQYVPSAGESSASIVQNCFFATPY